MWENGAAGEKNFEHFDPESLEALFDTLEDWNEQLKQSDFENWDAKQAPSEEPQP